MGPQLYRCGNVVDFLGVVRPQKLLQWGRNFIVAETDVLYSETIGSGGASMGPQLYRCGNATLGPIIGSDYG